ncbi:uncharacterized protein DDB_G0271670-like [Aphidius gifuensis]|uniref:uncharacterized protein DDB_G0271670-like n=1 Tax=Aphidius gifuensis TaxID=684658 RepID=UPI001CDCF85D|nr:uncharacterized protein DDB_G0271670-like [Aphidius gifuensis]
MANFPTENTNQMETDAELAENVQFTDYSEYFTMEFDDIEPLTTSSSSCKPSSQSTPQKRTNVLPINTAAVGSGGKRQRTGNNTNTTPTTSTTTSTTTTTTTARRSLFKVPERRSLNDSSSNMSLNNSTASNSSRSRSQSPSLSTVSASSRTSQASICCNNYGTDHTNRASKLCLNHRLPIKERAMKKLNQNKEKPTNFETHTIKMASISVLEKKMSIIDGFQSPDRTINPKSLSIDESSTPKMSNIKRLKTLEVNLEKEYDEKISSNRDSEDEIEERKITNKKKPIINLEQENNIERTNNIIEPAINLEQEYDKQILSDQHFNNNIDKSKIIKQNDPSNKLKTNEDVNVSNKRKSNEEYVTKEDLKNFAADFLTQLGINPHKKYKTSDSTDENSKTDSNIKLKVLESKDKEHQLEIPYDKWKTAKTKSTCTSMTWSLVLAAFDQKTLIASNYHGGASKKISNDKNQMKLKKLDENIILIIKETVRDRFPTQFNAVSFGSNINTRLSQLRKNTQLQQEKIEETTNN